MLAKETLEILKSHNITLNRTKGQNYLINYDVLSNIITYADLSREDTILEVGAGIGTLTIPLANRAGKVIAVEQDEKIAAILKKRLTELGVSNVEIMVADAAKIDFPPFNKVISNLPYKISSPVTFKLLKNRFDFGILMYQLEFAERMAAKPGDSNYSRLSVMLNLSAEVELLEEVSKTAFFPKPKVSSAIVKLVPKENPIIDEFFLKVLRALFQHKRKKARNALLDSFHEISDLNKKTVKATISKLNPYLMEKRVMELKADDIIKISHGLSLIIKK